MPDREPLRRDSDNLIRVDVTVYVDDGNGDHGEFSQAIYAEGVREVLEGSTLYDVTRGYAVAVIGVVERAEISGAVRDA